MVTPAPNGAGWNHSTVVLSFVCADSGSGIPPNACPGSVSYTVDGTYPFAASVSDVAGNTATITGTVKLDQGKPVIMAVVTPTPNAAGWTKGPTATVTFTCADPGSGTPSSSGIATCPAPVMVTAEGTTVVTRTATDIAGNVGSATATVKLDRTPPVVAVSGFPLLPICITTDALSGVATHASLGLSYSVVAGVSTATATCSGGTDRAGNLAPPVSRSYPVPLVFIGFLSPIANPSVVNVGTAGKSYTVPWQLWTLWATRVSLINAVTSETFAAVSCTTFSSKTQALPAGGTAASGLVYDTTTNRYVYTWKTPTTKGCYVLSIKLADGNTYKANFKLN